jgi:molybdate transport system substrate-binding protein
MAVLNNSKNPEAAKTFTEYLTSDSAKTIFEKFGFGLSS